MNSSSKTSISRALIVLLLCAGVAHAGGRKRIVVLDFEGPKAEKFHEDVVKLIKDSKAKVQASIQGDTVRVSGKDRDTLQQVIAALKAKDFGINMQFTNYRSN